LQCNATFPFPSADPFHCASLQNKKQAASFAMAQTLPDLYAAFVLFEEFLGWLPCQQVRCTRRYALHHSAAARLHNLVRQLEETVALQATPNWAKKDRLWSFLLARISACQMPRIFSPQPFPTDDMQQVTEAVKQADRYPAPHGTTASQTADRYSTAPLRADEDAG
jgi:hypothetical protein